MKRLKTIPHSRPSLGREEKKACARVLDSLHIAQGPRVEEFEHSFARSAGRKYGVAVSSGTAALAMVLKALQLGHGRQVLIPSYTCAALLHALDFTGARAVLADISAEDMNLCAVSARQNKTRKTAAMIVPHMFGRTADMRALARLGFPLIEDGTQALGAQAFKKPVGSFGEAGIFSFYATKMMTTGEGGMIVTDSAKLAAGLRDMRDYDKKNDYGFRMNFKMTDLAAALGLEQLKKLPGFVLQRQETAGVYDAAFKNTPLFIPACSRERPSVYFRYVLRVPGGAAALLRHLNRQGIEAKSPVFKPLHSYAGFSDRHFPETARALREACSLPIYPGLSAAKARSVIREALRNTAI